MFNSIYVLTIPGFYWTKVSDDPDHDRAEHVCVNMNDGQLITLGGLRYHAEQSEDWDSRDPFTRGIGIFNLNAFAWESYYNSDADEYRLHEDMKSWYSDGYE